MASYKQAFNPLGDKGHGDFDLVSPDAAFVTVGANGITTERWQSTPGGILYDLTINDTGNLVTTAVVTPTGTQNGLLLALSTL